MVRRALVRLRWLSLLTLSGLGCGQLEFPVTLALVGDNVITLEVFYFPPGQNTFSTTLVGGAEARILVDLTNPLELLQPEGIAANVIIDRVLIAGPNINLFTLRTGTICTYEDPSLESGGIAFLRPIQNEGEFHLTMNTLIGVTDPRLLTLFPDPLPFAAQIDDTTRVTLVDMINIAAGRGADIEVSQVIVAVLPEDIPILGNSTITADVTLKSVEEFPVDPLLDECEAFLAGP